METITPNCLLSTKLIKISLTLLAVTIVIFNFWTIIILLIQITVENYKIPQQFFKLSLSLADLGIGIFKITTSIHKINLLFSIKLKIPASLRGNETQEEFEEFCDNAEKDRVYIQAMAVLNYWVLFASNYTLAFSAVDRYKAMQNPFKYKSTTTANLKQVGKVIVFVWILSLFLAMVPYRMVLSL